MNQAQGGTAALVTMRQEILGALRAQPELTPLDSDLRHLFASWFNRGFLELRRIDWNTAGGRAGENARLRSGARDPGL